MTTKEPAGWELGDRAGDLVAKLNDYRAKMEYDPNAAAAFVLAASRLAELMPHVLRDYRRMRSLTDVDPNKCRATFLSCDRRLEGTSDGSYSSHEEHFDHGAGTHWSRGPRGEITMTYGG